MSPDWAMFAKDWEGSIASMADAVFITSDETRAGLRIIQKGQIESGRHRLPVLRYSENYQADTHNTAGAGELRYCRARWYTLVEFRSEL